MDATTRAIVPVVSVPTRQWHLIDAPVPRRQQPSSPVKTRGPASSYHSFRSIRRRETPNTTFAHNWELLN